METQILIKVSLQELKEIVRTSIREELQSHNKEPPKAENVYWTRTQVCKYLQISLPTCSDYTKRGILKGYRISSKIRYLKSDVESSLTLIKSVKGRRGNQEQ